MPQEHAADRIESRAVAVRSIVARIAARDCHVLAAHPGAGLTELAIALSELRGWIAFADVGGRQVLRTVTLAELLIAHVTHGAAAVALVPVCAVDRERLETVLGRTAAAPGSVTVLGTGLRAWPALLAEALPARPRPSATRKRPVKRRRR